MNIEKAKQKWCPFARAPIQLSISDYVSNTMVSRNKLVVGNRTYGPDSGCKCLADGCMAWRTVLNDPTDGHCGLAGFAPHGGGE